MSDPDKAQAIPKIVCLCGSTRFKDAFVEANLRETLAGNIVLTIGCDMRTDNELFGAMSPDELEQTKDNLDRLHLWKIWQADEVLILNVGGYIGVSTTRELWFARELRRAIRYLEPSNIAGVLVKVSTFAAKMHSGNPDPIALQHLSLTERKSTQQRAEQAEHRLTMIDATTPEAEREAKDILRESNMFRADRDRLAAQVSAMREAAEHLLFIHDNNLSIDTQIITNGMIDEAWTELRAALAAPEGK